MLRTRVSFGAVEPAGPSWPAVLHAVMSVAVAVYPGGAVLRMVAHIDDVVTVGPPPRTAFVDVVLDAGRRPPRSPRTSSI